MFSISFEDGVSGVFYVIGVTPEVGYYKRILLNELPCLVMWEAFLHNLIVLNFILSRNNFFNS